MFPTIIGVVCYCRGWLKWLSPIFLWIKGDEIYENYKL